MAEYIEREAAISIARSYCHTPNGRCCGPDDVVELYEELKAIPAADVVEVVRCKDCVPIICPLNGRHKGDNDYCSFGIPRE